MNYRRQRRRRLCAPDAPVRLTDDAARDLAVIEGWYRQAGAGRKASAQLQAITLAIRGLATYPCAWRRGAIPNTRELLSRGHRVLYELQPDTGNNQTSGDVLVLRIFGPGQDY